MTADHVWGHTGVKGINLNFRKHLIPFNNRSRTTIFAIPIPPPSVPPTSEYGRPKSIFYSVWGFLVHIPRERKPYPAGHQAQGVPKPATSIHYVTFRLLSDQLRALASWVQIAQLQCPSSQ